MKKTILNFVFIASASVLMAQKPVADFRSCQRLAVQYEEITFTDLSTNTPTSWEWDVYDSVSNPGTVMSITSGDVIPDPFTAGNDQYSQNMQVAFYTPGLYTVVLKASNASGNSVMVKKQYIKVIAPYDFYLSYGQYGPKLDNRVYNDFGNIHDDGGPNLNYGNNLGIGTKGFLKITPTNQKNVEISFKQLKLSNTGDTIFVYDDDTIVSGKRLAALTYLDNGTYPSFMSTSPKMFILFKTDGSGVDSGFKASFQTSDGNPLDPKISFIKTVPMLHVPVLFINNYSSDFKPFFDEFNWYVDDTLQTLFKNKDTFVYIFGNSSTVNIKLEAKSCNFIRSYSENINANLAVTELKQNAELIAYPNPSAGTFSLKGREVKSCQLFDINGRKLSVQFDPSSQTLNCSGLSNAVYFLRAVYADGSVGYLSLSLVSEK